MATKIFGKYSIEEKYNIKLTKNCPKNGKSCQSFETIDLKKNPWFGAS
jgi:hypothetical protein